MGVWVGVEVGASVVVGVIVGVIVGVGVGRWMMMRTVTVAAPPRVLRTASLRVTGPLGRLVISHSANSEG